MIRRVLTLAINNLRLHRDPVRYFRSQGADIGEDVEIYGANLFTFGSEPYLVSIGNQVTISHNVDFITHDGGVRVARHKYPGAYLYGRIHVADNCFLGARCILLPGARVGAGSVIGSGSIVTGEIPAGVVAVGAPARPIRPIADYIDEKRDLWIDTRDLAPAAKRELLLRLLPLSPTYTAQRICSPGTCAGSVQAATRRPAA
jgi:acetyltransferase-like isoleucine patch superfamily enzyme